MTKYIFPPGQMSVVMVTYNTGPVLFRAIEAVLAQADLHELIVVNNGNPVEVREKLFRMAKDYPNFYILSGQGNIGFARGCNIGITRATGDYVMFLNPDSILPARTFAPIIRALEDDPKRRLAGCKIIDPSGKEQRGSRRNILKPWTAFVEIFRLGRFFPKHTLNIHHTEAPREVSEVPAISGACMVMHRERYEEMGGLDPSYFLHVEDMDLCLRVHQGGGKVIFIPEIAIVHYRSTSKVSSIFVEWCKARGFIYYFRKHFKGHYFPGVLLFAYLGVLLRFIVKVAQYIVFERLNFVKYLKNKYLRQQGLRRAFLLEQYRDRSRQINYDISSNEPVLLIGATSQLGIAVLRKLLAQNTRVIALYRDNVVDFSHPQLTWIYGDIESGIDISSIQPLTVISATGLWLLPKNLDSFREAGVKRIIAFSSTSVISKSDSFNPKEKALTKKLYNAERELIELGNHSKIAVTIFRPTMVYGLGLDRNIMMIRHLIEIFRFFPILPPASGLRQPVHAEDLADVVLSTIDNKKTIGNIYNLAGGETLSYRAMIERIFEALGIKTRVIELRFLPSIVKYVGLCTGGSINPEMVHRMNKDLVFSFEEAKEDFNYMPRAFLTRGRKDLGE